MKLMSFRNTDSGDKIYIHKVWTLKLTASRLKNMVVCVRAVAKVQLKVSALYMKNLNLIHVLNS
jgi:hypothetical protein